MLTGLGYEFSPGTYFDRSDLNSLQLQTANRRHSGHALNNNAIGGVFTSRWIVTTLKRILHSRDGFDFLGRGLLGFGGLERRGDLGAPIMVLEILLNRLFPSWVLLENLRNRKRIEVLHFGSQGL